MSHKEEKVEMKKLGNGFDEPSTTKVAVGVAAAGGAGLLAATLVGVGPAALAGAAGYLAYKGFTGKRSENEQHNR